jgi:hypothetical protein
LPARDARARRQSKPRRTKLRMKVVVNHVEPGNHTGTLA